MVIFLICICELLISNIGLGTGFPETLQANAGIVPQLDYGQPFFKILSNLSFTYHPAILQYAAWNSESASKCP